AVGEDAPADKGNAQSLEEGGRDGVQSSERAAVAGGFVLAFGKNGAAEAAAERKIRGDGSGLHARRGGSAVDGGAEELFALAFVVVQCAEIESHHEEVFVLEAGFDALGSVLAADEEASAEEGDESEGGFGDDEKATSRIGTPTNGVAAASSFQSVGKIRSGGFDRGDGAEEGAGEQGDAQGEEQN